MQLTTARDVVRKFTRNGIDTSAYPTTAVDYAIVMIGNRLVRETDCTVTTGEIAITADDYELVFDQLDGNFRPAWIRSLRIADDDDDYTTTDITADLDITDVQQIRDHRHGNTTSGVPTEIGFISWSEAEVYPTPSKDGTLNVVWTQPFVSITAGTATPDSVPINIPDDIFYEALMYGGPAMLHASEKENAPFSEKMRAEFDAYVQRVRGMAQRGAKVFQRETTAARGF